MTAVAYAHPTISRLAIADGMLHIGGLPVGLLAERAGATPFFAYERTGLTRRVEELRRALPNDIHLSYAVKGNPMPAVVQHFSRQVDGFDVASAGEMAVALDTPIPADRVSFAGPGKTPAELSRAVAARVTISLESETEALRVAAIGERLGVRPRVAVRVNPDFQVKGSGMRLGGGPQQFGVDAEQVPVLLTRLAAMDLDVLGFHVFAGSQNLYADILAEAHGRTADLVVRLAGAAPQPVRYINLGGGLSIPYFERDQALDLATIGDNLSAVMSERLRPALPEARIVLELGRYLVGEAGGHVTRVVDRKESRGHTFLVVDGGLHHQLAASGNFGQVIRKTTYPVAIANRMAVPGAETVSVVGCLCTPLDLLARDVCLPRAEIGDPVAVFQAGAYGMTASPTAFLGPSDTDGAVGIDRRPTGLHDRWRSHMTRSPEISQAIFEDVKAVVVVTLDIEDQADDLVPETGLYGNLPELDSLTVVKLIVALQKRFGIEIEIDEIVGDIFDTLGRLAAFVESKVHWEPLGGVKY